MNTMTIDQTAYSTTVAKFSDLIMRATVAQVEQASVWYFEAEAVAREVAANMTLDLDRAACIVSAFSPRERWSVNVRKALAYSVGLPVTGLSNNVTMADASLVHGFDALKGLKTNAVVIDVWMCRAADLGTDSPNKTQYNFLADAVRDAAQIFGLSPRTAQALIWIIVRGSAA
jgi:hypothetical protein